MAALDCRVLDRQGVERWRERLADLLLDGFAAGAALGFRPPLTRARALDYWDEVGGEVAAGAIDVVGAWRGVDLWGSIQLHPDRAGNGPHRAEVAKLVVASEARRQGVASALLDAIENVARGRGITLLHLTTHVGLAAESLYRSAGWTETGVVRGWALGTAGEPVDNVFFWKPVRP